MDIMSTALNKEIQSNITPYWRNHNSVKGKTLFCNLSNFFTGWTNMNYPTTMVNPLLKHKKQHGGAVEQMEQLQE